MVVFKKTDQSFGRGYWIAPELLSTNSKEINSSVDIWSFGMLLFEMMTNKKPYHDVEEKEIAQQILNKKLPNFPKDFSTQETSIKSLLFIYGSCLEFEPSNRVSIHDLKEQLLNLL